ncbi:MAG: nucleotidyltransferase family protein [Chloroflexi bacterium]|nr:nucleotidyltransferase family protein [Chloroflexota bacterium]MCI0580506.1 nucleotidyltransferase family protein [Chloroflexota bacterium]MCI0643557.1 nucleotidyltransferase family protein [Chloroflexota bacterium]MCI0729647.1 nucleotidyltransferase family protein [Chloroflexota bacterium]
MSRNAIPPAVAKISPDGRLTLRQRRRLFLEMGLRKQKAGTGSSLEFLKRRTAMVSWPDLRDLLQGVPWAIIGGVATRAYMPERMTRDLDILVSEADRDEVINRLQAAGFTRQTPLAVPGYLFLSPDGVEVDVLFGSDPWLEEALNRPGSDPAGYPVLDLPYLVLMKLNATRAQDWADVSRMVGLASDQELDRVRQVVARYSPEDSEDLETLIYLGRLELKTPPEGEE